MIGLIQRVTSASVTVENCVVGEISQGLLVLVGLEKEDDLQRGERLVDRILKYRVFNDDQNKMNLSLVDIAGGLLLVPQFTLAADTRKGARPSFSSAMPPNLAEPMFGDVVAAAKARYGHVETGEFGADMQVKLSNDGPVTFWLSS